MFSKKAAKIDEIVTVDLTLCRKCQIVVKMSSIFAAFLENMNSKFFFNKYQVHIILSQFCSLSDIHLNWYHVMHSVVIIFAQDPQLSPPYPEFFLYMHKGFLQKKKTQNIFWKICESHQFFTMSERLLWYLIYLLPMSFTNGPKPFHLFSLNSLMSNFVNIKTALSNFVKEKHYQMTVFSALLL